MKVIVDRLFQRFQERIHGRDSAPRGSGPAETILEGPGAVLVKPLGVAFSFSICLFVFPVFVHGVSLFVSFAFVFCFNLVLLRLFTFLTVLVIFVCMYVCLHSLGGPWGPWWVLRTS
jgi:hypothetical protein